VHNVERNAFRARRATFDTDSVHNVERFADLRGCATLFGAGAKNVAHPADRRVRSTFSAPATEPAHLPGRSFVCWTTK